MSPGSFLLQSIFTLIMGILVFRIGNIKPDISESSLLIKGGGVFLITVSTIGIIISLVLFIVS